jgi:hypothetical protein
LGSEGNILSDEDLLMLKERVNLRARADGQRSEEPSVDCVGNSDPNGERTSISSKEAIGRETFGYELSHFASIDFNHFEPYSINVTTCHALTQICCCCCRTESIEGIFIVGMPAAAESDGHQRSGRRFISPVGYFHSHLRILDTDPISEIVVSIRLKTLTFSGRYAIAAVEGSKRGSQTTKSNCEKN